MMRVAFSSIVLLFFNFFSFADTLDVAKLRASLPTLTFGSVPAYSKPVRDYFDYYDLNHAHCTHFFGTFRSGSYTLAGHLYISDSCRGTAFLFHGYYDHTGILKNLISYCLDRKFSVASVDLPGHGLSTGEPAAIDSFAEYGAAVIDFLNICSPHATRPFVGIGHSTGCAALLTACFLAQENRFSRLILLAPLIRSEYWALSKAGYALAPNANNLPRWMRTESHDEAFLRWFDSDPLQVKRFPVRWAKALFAWEARMDSATPRRFTVSVVQGTADNTVDWRHNVPLLQNKFPACDVHFIRDARHQLLNESRPYRVQCLGIIGDVLDSSATVQACPGK